MIFTTEQLIEKYSNYIDPKGKIARCVRDKQLYRIVRGYYETDINTDGEKLAQIIYGPSYLSFDYALAYYGLIPESVTVYTSATFNKEKKKMYKNNYGIYVYRDVPKDVFKYDIIVKVEGEYVVHIATPEKALCDKLYTIHPVKNIGELKELIFEDLRIYKESFDKLNHNNLIKLSKLYHSTNLNLLAKMIKGEYNKCNKL